eukprot:6814858-Pyramimonas_sp.AAC.1
MRWRRRWRRCRRWRSRRLWPLSGTARLRPATTPRCPGTAHWPQRPGPAGCCAGPSEPASPGAPP